MTTPIDLRCDTVTRPTAASGLALARQRQQAAEQIAPLTGINAALHQAVL